MNTDPLLLVLDFGGTKHAAAVIRLGAREWLARDRRLSPPQPTADTDLAIMLEMGHGLLSDLAGDLVAVGVSFGGPVDASSGTVRLSHHVPGWEGYSLSSELEAKFGVPVSVDNDANAGAIGEWRFGAGRGCESLLYVTVSTGVGGGWILGGRPYRGAGGMAGEIGHTVIQPDGPACLCGRRGCLETLACGPAIAARAREQLLAMPQSGQILRELCDGQVDTITAEIVSRAAEDGDALAAEVLTGAARALGAGIGDACSLMNPQRVVLGGGVSKSGERYWTELRRAAQGNTLAEITVDIVQAELGDDSPLWGAVALAEIILPGC